MLMAETTHHSRVITLEGEFNLSGQTGDWLVPGVTDGVTIDATKAKFRSDDRTVHVVGGELKATLRLSGPAARHDVELKIPPRGNAIEPGQIVRLFSRTKFDPGETKSTIEWNQVVGVKGANVYLQFPLLCDHDEAEVDFYSAAKDVRWIGGEFIGTSLRMSYLSSPHVSGVTVQGPLRYGIFILGCVGDTARDCTVRDPGHHIGLDAVYGSPGQRYGYGIIHTNCANSNVVDCHGYNGWHIFDAADGVRDVTYTNCSASGSLYGFSTHQSCVSASYVNCDSLGKHGHTHRCRYLNIEGGLIHNESLSGVALTSNQWDARIKGVRFQGRPDRRNADITVSSGPAQSHPQRITIEGCEFGSLKGINLSTSAPGSSIRFRGNEITCGRDSGSIGLASATLRIDSNTLENLGSNGFVLSGDRVFVRGNEISGERLASPEASFIHSQGDSGEFHIEDNTIDIDLFRVMRVIRDGIAVKSFSRNNLLRSTTGGIIQLQQQAKRLRVDNCRGNLFSHQTNKFGAGVEVNNAA